MENNTKIIIGVSVGVVLIVGGVATAIYMDKRRSVPATSPVQSKKQKEAPTSAVNVVTYPASPYASSAAITKIKNGSYEPYVDDITTSVKINNDYKDWQKEVLSSFGYANRDGVNSKEDYPRAWFKGMNLAMSKKYFDEFKNDIINYSNGIYKMPFWDIQSGEYINF